MVEFQETVLLIVAAIVPILWTTTRTLLDIFFSWLKTKTSFYWLVPEERVREAVEQAINYGISYATTEIKDAGALTIKHDNKFLIVALEYIKASIPQSLERFKIDDERLIAMIKARL